MQWARSKRPWLAIRSIRGASRTAFAAAARAKRSKPGSTQRRSSALPRDGDRLRQRGAGPGCRGRPARRIDAYQDKQRVYPMIHYALGFYLDRLGPARRGGARVRARCENAAGILLPVPPGGDRDPAACARAETVRCAGALLSRQRALRCAANGGDRRVGTRQGRSIPSLAMARRNLALAYARRENNLKKAMPELEAAFALRRIRAGCTNWTWPVRRSGASGASSRFRRYPGSRLTATTCAHAPDHLLQVQTGAIRRAVKLLGADKFNI